MHCWTGRLLMVWLGSSEVFPLAATPRDRAWSRYFGQEQNIFKVTLENKRGTGSWELRGNWTAWDSGVEHCRIQLGIQGRRSWKLQNMTESIIPVGKSSQTHVAQLSRLRGKNCNNVCGQISHTRVLHDFHDEDQKVKNDSPGSVLHKLIRFGWWDERGAGESKELSSGDQTPATVDSWRPPQCRGRYTIVSIALYYISLDWEIKLEIQI